MGLGYGCTDDVLPQASSGRSRGHSGNGLERVEGEIGGVAVVIVSRFLLGEGLMSMHIGRLLLMVTLKTHFTWRVSNYHNICTWLHRGPLTSQASIHHVTQPLVHLLSVGKVNGEMTMARRG